MKDLMHSGFWFIYFCFLIEFISLFLPHTEEVSNIVYLLSHIGVVMNNFHSVSFLVLVYIQYVYVFYNSQFDNIDVSVLRMKSLLWKFILLIICLFLNYVFPSKQIPTGFKLLTHGCHQHDR